MDSREKIKLYIYPHAKQHTHDKTDLYYNTVPLSKKGIQDHFVLSPPEKADYFYMGQLSDDIVINKEKFEFFEGKEERHVCDIEGDWFQKKIPQWLEESILTINSVKKEYVEKNIKMFIRPTFSHLFMEIIKNNLELKFNFNDNRSFGFKGLPDPLHVREKMWAACKSSQIKFDIEFNDKWAAQTSPSSSLRKKYCKKIMGNTFSLCPRGSGLDSARFFESCFFSRIPVFISHSPYIFGSHYNIEKPFYFQIDADLSVEEIRENLIKIHNTSTSDLKEMSYNSKMFFEDCVRNYFNDPTKNFLEWMENEEE